MISGAPHVEILLSTFNGEKYLEEFLDSLLSQNYTDWSVIVRDDGSNDGTVSIINRWRQSRSDRIRLLESLAGNIGVIGSYSELLRSSSARYVMFADQDDIWLPDKIEVVMNAMQRREAETSRDMPIIVHTDLVVVDEDLRLVARSSWAYQGLAPGRGRLFPRIIVENIVWGCTAMLNRALIERVGDIPVEAGHHDWWIALVAAAFGEIISLEESSILWRRHGLNVSQISGVHNLSFGRMTDIRAARKKLATLLTENRLRVSTFLGRYREKLKPADIASAEAFLRMPQRTAIGKRLDILRYGLYFGSKRRNIGMFALL